MLRRPPTVLALTNDDLAAFDIRHQARIAAHSRTLAQQREQVRDANGQTQLGAQARRERQQQPPQQRSQVSNPTNSTSTTAPPCARRQQHAPGEIQTGSPGFPVTVDTTIGLTLDGATPTSPPPHTRRSPTARRAPLSFANQESSSNQDIDNEMEEGDEDDHPLSPHRLVANASDAADVAASAAPNAPPRPTNHARTDAERRRQVERERILGRGHDGADGASAGAGGGTRRQQHLGGGGVVGERAPRR